MEKRYGRKKKYGECRFNGRRKSYLLRALCIASVVLISAIAVLLIPRQYTVRGLSMEPTLNDGDNLNYTRFNTPRYGDLIVFQEKQYGLIVKRVIGLPGDRISVNADGSVLRNGEPLVEPYIKTDKFKNSAMDEVTVEAGKLFVMGDNRAESIDSRDARIGEISIDSVYGTVSSRKPSE